MHSPGVQTGLVRCTRMLRIRTLSLFSDSALCAHVPTCVLNRCCLLKCFCILSTSCDICIALAMYDTYMYIYIFYFIVWFFWIWLHVNYFYYYCVTLHLFKLVSFVLDVHICLVVQAMLRLVYVYIAIDPVMYYTHIYVYLHDVAL